MAFNNLSGLTTNNNHKVISTGSGNIAKVSPYFDMWVVSSDDVPKIAAALNGEGFWNTLREIFSINDIKTCVRGLMVFPFDVNTENYNEHIKIGNEELEDPDTENAIRGWPVLGTVQNRVKYELTVATPNPLNFLEYEPFTKYELYLPFVGKVPLNSNLILGKTLTISYNVDMHTGVASVFVYNGNATIHQSECQVGFYLPFGFTGEGEQEVKRALGIIGSGIALAAGAGAVAIPSLTHTLTEKTTTTTTASGKQKTTKKSTTTDTTNTKEDDTFAASLKTATTLFNGVTSLINNKSSLINGSTAGPLSAFSQPLTPILFRHKTHIHNINNYASEFGYATAKEITLSQHSGYCRLSRVHMPVIPGATPSEIKMIEDALLSGVYLPGYVPPTPPTPTDTAQVRFDFTGSDPYVNKGTLGNTLQLDTRAGTYTTNSNGLTITKGSNAYLRPSKSFS